MIKQLRYFCTLLLIAVASVAWGDEVTATFAPSDFSGQGTSGTGSEISAIVDGVTFACDKGFGTTEVRCYSGSTIKISSENTITKIAFTFSGSYNGGMDASYGGLSTTSWSKTLTSQARLKEIVVTYAEPGTAVEVVAAPVFNPAGGVYTSAQSVAITTATDGATIYYTLDGSVPTEESTVYAAPISVDGAMTIKAVAMKEGMNNSSVETAEYLLLDHAGTEADPYTVADARKAIEAGKGMTDVYAMGVVSEIVTAYSTEFGNITFNFVDENGAAEYLEAYRCKGEEAANVQVGDKVVVRGTLTKYGEIYEFGAGCELVSLTHAAYPIIVADDLTLEYNATLDTLHYSVSNPVEGVKLKAATSADWISDIVVEEGLVIFKTTVNEGTADRTATMTLAYEGAEEVEVTITQGHFVADYATLPFEFDGGVGAIATTSGLTQTGLGTDYPSSPKLKFDGTGDELVLHFDGVPGTLTFDIKGNGFSGGTFTVQTSKDGESYTDMESYSELGATQSEEFTNLASDIRYIKWVYTEKVSGNVALGNISLKQYEAPQLYKLAIANPENVTITANYGEEILTNGEAAEVDNGTEITLALTIPEGFGLESLTVAGEEEGQTVTLTESAEAEGVYTFTMPAYNVTVSATVVEVQTVTYVLATSITPGKHYIITNGTDKAMGKQNSNNRAAADVTIADDKATVVSNAGVYEFVIDVNATDGYTIFDENEASKGYLYAASSSSNYLRTQETNNANGVWSIEIDETGVATIKAQGTNTRNLMRYNSVNTLFSCYANGQDDVYLYEKESDATVVPGDVNKDGSVTVADLEALVKILLGTNTAEDDYNMEAADVNGDEEITVGDVSALVDILLGGE